MKSLREDVGTYTPDEVNYLDGLDINDIRALLYDSDMPLENFVKRICNKEKYWVLLDPNPITFEYATKFCNENLVSYLLNQTNNPDDYYDVILQTAIKNNTLQRFQKLLSDREIATISLLNIQIFKYDRYNGVWNIYGYNPFQVLLSDSTLRGTVSNIKQVLPSDELYTLCKGHFIPEFDKNNIIISATQEELNRMLGISFIHIMHDHIYVDYLCAFNMHMAGVGTVLLDIIVEIAILSGFKSVELFALSSAAKFYQKYGFDIDEDGDAIYNIDMNRADAILYINNRKKDVNLSNKDVVNQIMLNAARKNDVKLVRKMMEKGGNLFDQVALIALRRGNVPLMKQMLKKGANNYNNLLVVAAELGYMDLVKSLIRKGADEYDDAMVAAVTAGHKDIVNLLLKKGAKSYNKSMQAAAMIGDMSTLHEMIDRGATDFNRAAESAVEGGHRNIVDFLLEKGANNYNDIMIAAAYRGDKSLVNDMVDKGANKYNTAMIKAAGSGHLSIVEMIIDKGVEGYVYNQALWDAVRGGHVDVIDKLLHCPGIEHDRVIYRAVSTPCSKPVIVKKLLKFVPVSLYNEIMLRATASGCIDIVDIMLEAGANNYDECLQRAIYDDNITIANKMLEAGATDYDKALVAAAWLGDMEFLYKLLGKGATSYDEALIAAAKGGSTNAVNLLLKKSATSYDEALIAAAVGGYLDIVKIMLQNGATEIDKALDVSTHNRHTAIAEEMLRRGATVTEQVFLYAIKNGSIDLVRDMRKKIEIENYNKPILEAIAYGHTNIVKLLIKEKNSVVNRALILAAALGHLDIVKIMLKKSAKTLNEALVIAASRGNANVVKYLLQKGARSYKEALVVSRNKIVREMLQKKVSKEYIDDIRDVLEYLPRYSKPFT